MLTYNEKLDEIIEKLDIVDIVSKYIQIKQSGRSYKGLCPFHSEKTPSFFVSPEKQIFHCFGCGTGGNVITFLMKIENISFSEAVRIAADMAGVKISSFSDENDARKKLIFESNKIANEFFSLSLNSSSGNVASEFLEKRGIDQENQKKFGLGYAPAGNRLVEFLLEKKLKMADFEMAGLITKNENGYSDFFRHRITIPIFDHNNNIVGFGARALEQQQQPKYLNTSENLVFKKGCLFFGLNLAKEKIKKSGFAIIVEGYFDLIKMHMAGFENTIAPLGTALTERHLKLLKRWTDKILLVFDSDSAGTSAAFKSLEAILSCGFEVKIGIMPPNFDPEDFLDNYGAQALKKLLNQSKDFVDFAFQIGSQKYSLDSPKGKASLIEEILTLIKNIPDDIERFIRIKELSGLTGIDTDILSKQLSELPEKDGLKKIDQSVIKTSGRHAVENAEKTLLKILLNQPEWANEIAGCIDFLPESVRLIIDCCIKKQISQDNISRILNQLNNPEHASILTGELLKETKQEYTEITRKEFFDCVATLCRKSTAEKAKELKEIIKQKMENSLSCEKELEELNFYLHLISQKSIEPFLTRVERSADGKE